MQFFKYIAPSELLLLKALILGAYFGWNGRKVLRPKTHEIENMKFYNVKEKGKYL